MITAILRTFRVSGEGLGGLAWAPFTDWGGSDAVRSAIAIIMAVLGTILVLSGAAALWASALTRPDSLEGADGVVSRFDRTVDTVGKVPSPDRLITWGVVLLGLSAVAAGAIGFSATATAGPG